jgi:hypothetical protein
VDVRITLDGNEVKLEPSFAAAKRLSEKYVGLLPLMDHLNLGSVSAATDVIYCALGKPTEDKNKIEHDRLAALVYDAGIRYLAPLLVQYVILLMNGGKSDA